MNQEDAFLLAILEDPDDDAVRLIFADWLEEHGDPRGEFIRVQIELTRLPKGDSRHGLLAFRARQLLDEHAPTWVGPLSAWVIDYQFHRGFIEEITVSAAAFLSHAAELFRGYPIQTVRLRYSLAHLPAAPGLRAGKYAASHLLNSPYLARLAALDLREERLGDQELQALLGSPQLNRLSRLDLASNQITAAGVQVLAASPLLVQLTVLNLSNNPIDSLGVQALAGSPAAVNLTRLDLDQTRLANSGARALLESPYLTRLLRLSLRGNDISAPLHAALLRKFGPQVCLL